jgi:hypothetical protein
MPYGLLEELT